MAITVDFADYCCELLSSLGPCRAKRMFGGWGISIDGMSVAILVNLGQGDTLWLKVDEDSKPLFEAEGCARFTYEVKGQLKGMNYYAAPADAMESPALMAPWARLALAGGAGAHAPRPPKNPSKPKLAKPPRSR